MQHKFKKIFCTICGGIGEHFWMKVLLQLFLNHSEKYISVKWHKVVFLKKTNKKHLSTWQD